MGNIVDVWLPVLLVIISAASAFFAVKFGLSQVQKDVAELKVRTEENDKEHDKSIADHDKRLAVLESRFDETIGAMKAQIAEIYQKLIG